MMVKTRNINIKPVMFLAFANDRNDIDSGQYLRNLPQELRQIREVLKECEDAGLCEIVERGNCTAKDIFKVFQSPQYLSRIAVFHYGGHANDYELLLESHDGELVGADAEGLADFLGHQLGLKLVFLNGCSTQRHVQGLLNAKVSAVLSTSRLIDDGVASDFSSVFYQGIGGGVNIRTAYESAIAAIKTVKGNSIWRSLSTSADDEQDDEDIPWSLTVREGPEDAGTWSLPGAVDNPLFGLPELPNQDLPNSPYRYLFHFDREHAEVFFGRGHEIRSLYDGLTDPETSPIVLFYGPSGVGKSSVLAAGLIPRLEQTDYKVVYMRREGQSLPDLFRHALGVKSSKNSCVSAWCQIENKLEKPLIIILDQIEEVFTRPHTGVKNEIGDLLEIIKITFSCRDRRPKGKLVLSFRKEWLSEIETLLEESDLPMLKVHLERLNRKGIIEIVKGPTRTKRLIMKYRLEIESGLVDTIADDLCADRTSVIAPTLQILLSKMWRKATKTDPDQPRFTMDQYLNLKRAGFMMGDFLDQQMSKIRRKWKDVVDSGLLLDILVTFTTPLGTADMCRVEELKELYKHIGKKPSLEDILQECEDLYLLSRPIKLPADKGTFMCLAHDTLAPLVCERFESSDKPGQRARRILDAQLPDWKEDKTGSPLGENDFTTVTKGLQASKELTKDEYRLLDASKEDQKKRLRNKKRIKIFAISSISIIAIFSIVTLYLYIQADERKRKIETIFNEDKSYKAAQNGSLGECREYLKKYPDGKYTDDVLRITHLIEVNTKIVDEITDNKSNKKMYSPFDITYLTPDLAQRLIEHIQGYVHLENLAIINLKVAEQLSKFEGYSISFRKLQSISTLELKELLKLKCSEVNLDGLHYISPNMAKEFEHFKGTEISLNGLTDISNEIAPNLGKYKGILELKGLKSISIDLARHLADFNCEKMYFNMTQPIPINVAKEIVKNKRTEFHFSYYILEDQELYKILSQNSRIHWSSTKNIECIDKETATILKDSENRNLDLSFVTKLDQETAKIIGECSDCNLKLNGLKKLDKNVASELNKLNGTLELNGLEDISADDVNELVTNTRLKGLSLKIPNLSDKIAIQLGKYKKGDLTIIGLEKIAESAAKCLANYRGGRLKLVGSYILSKNIAQNLVSQEEGDRDRGEFYDLDLENIDQKSTYEIINELVKHKKGKLILYRSGFEITREIAQSLRKCKTPISVRITNLNNVNEDVIKPLIKHMGGRIEIFTYEYERISETTAMMFSKCLSKYKGDLSIQLSNEPSEEVTQVLARKNSKGFLSVYWRDLFNVDITVPVARALACYSGGDLRLNNLTRLSIQSARMLSEHKGGNLYLEGLESISDYVAEVFAEEYKGTVYAKPEIMAKIAKYKNTKDNKEGKGE